LEQPVIKITKRDVEALLVAEREAHATTRAVHARDNALADELVTAINSRVLMGSLTLLERFPYIRNAVEALQRARAEQERK